MIFDQRDLESKSGRTIRGAYIFLPAIAAIGITVYFAIYKPLFLEPEKYVRIQKEVRKDIDQKKIQPGDMRVWSHPYKPLPKE